MTSGKKGLPLAIFYRVKIVSLDVSLTVGSVCLGNLSQLHLRETDLGEELFIRL